MRFFSSLLVLILSSQTFGQSIKFVSDTDEDLTVKNVVVFPLVDNVKKIYAQPLTEALKKNLVEDKQWNIVEPPKNLTFTPEEFGEKPETVKTVLKKTSSDGLIAGRISKGPSGISIRLTLYAGKDGLPVGVETLNDFPGFETTELVAQIQPMAMKLKSKLPYRCTILSRKGQMVTMNIGASSGVKPGTEMTAIQVMKVTRHPKYNFVVNTDAVILGKVQVDKADEYISFGTILSEREPNVLGAGTKAIVDSFVEYPTANVTADGRIIGDLAQHPDSPMTLGDQPTEWVPQSPPTFGKVGILLGLGSYSMNASLSTGSVGATGPVTPSIHINGEMWFDPHWYAGLSLRSFIFAARNELAGSSPGTLNVQTTQTSLVGGYNFLMSEDFFGPKIRLSSGYSMMSSFVDNSTPTAFTSMTYSGLMFGVSGSFPVQLASKRHPLYLGGKLDLFLNPALSETPVSSGSSNNQITSFAAFADYQFSERMIAKGVLSFDLFSSTFGGGGSRVPTASSASHSITTFAAGLEYMF
jgi:hypothetical protein